MTLWPSQLRTGLHGKPCHTSPSHHQAAAVHRWKRCTKQSYTEDDCALVTCAGYSRMQNLGSTADRCSGEAAVSRCSSGSFRRRAMLASLGNLAAFIAPVTAQAAFPELAPPQNAGLAERLSRALPFPFPMVTPEPVRFPRKPLDQRFAVLLMRSSYDAVDQLDFIPRQSFEANFWKLRQSELEGYNYLYDPLKMRQGDLTGKQQQHHRRQCPCTSLSAAVQRCGSRSCASRLLVVPHQYTA
eukprot:GHUV01030348.1.p1 GENE.GHUV01030348.1~~GHUV01030348.1.p1  ORF type:complete len:242 (+),score=21.70 GHUV01030348.1:596-1321(+)